MQKLLIKIFVAITPLLVTLLFAWFVMAGDYFGNDKDIILVVPILAWSLIFLLTYIIFWWRKFTLGRTFVISAIVATGSAILISVWLFFGI
jgi:hypothetical protein